MSSPTVASLCRALGPDLVPAPGVTAPDRVISAVHISELQDPTGYVAGDELLLSTGLALPRTRRECDRYVSRLVAAGVSAFAIGLGPVHREVPPELAAACAEQGLPLLLVPVPTPFLRITSAFWSAVSEAKEQKLRDVLSAQRSLVDAAASSDAEPAVLRTVSRTLDGWAATFGPGGEIRHVMPRRSADQAAAVPGELERLRGAGAHSAASMTIGSSTVVIHPLAVEHYVVGFLAVGTSTPLDQARRRLVLTAVALLSLEAVRVSRADTTSEEAERCVAVLAERGYVEGARALAAAVGVPVPGERVRVLAVAGHDVGVIVDAVRRWCPDVIASGRSSTPWVLVPHDHPPLDELSRGLERAAPDAAAVLAETTPLTSVGAVVARTMAALGRLEPGTRLLEPSDAGGYDPAAVERLGTGLDRLDDRLVEALVAYLRHRGHWEAAAREADVHRNTLRHRIGRCEATLGADLADPDVAAELWLLMRRRAIA